jgi:hypothetical protein
MDDNLLDETKCAPSDEQIKKLNWPALACPWLWCFFHKLYLLGCVGIIPIIRIFIGFYLLSEGNRLDWERNKDSGVEKYFKRRKRWNRGTAIIFLCLLGIGSTALVYEEMTGGFSLKEHSFASGNLMVNLPFALEETTTGHLDENIAQAINYSAGDDHLNISISYTELKSENEFILDQMLDYSMTSLRKAKGMKIVSHKYEKQKYGNYPAGKMTVVFVTDGLACTTEYIYILVAKNRCWYLSTTYPNDNIKSKRISEKILNSIRLK